MMRIAAAQTPEFRNDIAAALDWAGDVVIAAAAEGVALLCFPEAYLQGYLTDASAHDAAIDLRSDAFAAIASRLSRPGLSIVLGLIERNGDQIYNTAVVIADGGLIGRYRKVNLLDGEGVFTPGTDSPTFEAGGLRFGINICFDTNFPAAAAALRDSGAMLIVCPANNMMPADRAAIWKDRHNAARGERCRETGLWLISADVTGAREGRIAWGPTAVLNPTGDVAAQLPLDATGLLLFDLPSEVQL
jgi:predicted amidohydrolase